MWGRLTKASEQLTAALEVLRPDADADTVRVLGSVAAVEVFVRSPRGPADH
jgi:hypothetical protein